MKIRNILSSIILVLALSLTVGFSAFVSEMSISNLVAEVRLNENVRITGVSVVSSSNGSMNSLDYDEDSILGNVNLKGANATVTLEVEVTNFGNTVMGIESHTGSATNLIYSVSDYEEKTSLCDESGNCILGSVTKFNVTLGYDTYDAVTKDHEFKLDFVFKKMHSITYTDITNNNFPSYIMDGQTLSVSLGSSAPSKLDVYSGGVLLDSSMYSYVNNTLTISEVTGDIEIKEHTLVAKVVSGDLNTPGSIVAIGDEQFYVFGQENGNVKLLSMYNLHVGNNVDENLDITSLESPMGIQDEDARGYVDGEFPFIGTTAFSSDSQKGTNYNDYNGSIVEGYVNNYVSYLERLGANIEKSRLITKEELAILGCSFDDYTCSGAPEFVYSTSYWSGSTLVTFLVWYVGSDADFGGYSYSSNDVLGVRPVIEMLVDEIIGPISFTVDGVTYLAADGMTWAEWVDSDYNTLNLIYDSYGYVRYGGSAGANLLKDSYTIYASDEVVANAIYAMSFGHSGGFA